MISRVFPINYKLNEEEFINLNKYSKEGVPSYVKQRHPLSASWVSSKFGSLGL